MSSTGRSEGADGADGDQQLSESAGAAASGTPASTTGALEIALINDLRELARVAAAIDGFCAEHDLSPRLGYAMNLAVEETLTSLVADGFGDDAAHPIEVAVYLDESEVQILIVSAGRAWTDARMLSPKPPDRNADRSLEAPDPDRLGLFLIHQVMDSVALERHHDCNVAILTKQIDTADDLSAPAANTEAQPESSSHQGT